MSTLLRIPLHAVTDLLLYIFVTWPAVPRYDGAMADASRVFLNKSRSLIASDYVPKIERCLDLLSADDIWWRPNEASNSIGNLILHLCGNVCM